MIKEITVGHYSGTNMLILPYLYGQYKNYGSGNTRTSYLGAVSGNIMPEN